MVCSLDMGHTSLFTMDVDLITLLPSHNMKILAEMSNMTKAMDSKY